MKKTSAEWYKEDTSFDIQDADGWRDLAEHAPDYWFQTRIESDEYQRRLELSTIVPFNQLSHRSPY